MDLKFTTKCDSGPINTTRLSLPVPVVVVSSANIKVETARLSYPINPTGLTTLISSTSPTVETARLSYSRKPMGLTTLISAMSPLIKNAPNVNVQPVQSNNNILYLFAHKTLTDFEVPIITSRGYGIFMPKQKKSLNKLDSIYDDAYKYDNSLQNMSVNDLHMLNAIDWYNNDTILTHQMIDLLNVNFKYIFVTLLTSGHLLTQLIKQFKGLIYYRFFGLASTYSYEPMVINYASPNVKYIFGYNAIYTYEQSLSSFFNSSNSHVIPLGCPDNFIQTYENSHKGINNKLCFVCSKINQCPYYTNVYNNFMKNFGCKYEYVLLGKNNEILTDNNKFNNLSDDAYFNKMSECKLMYYHSMEPRHLHYHPIEALIIGLPVLFHKESLLNTFLIDSPGKCNDIDEVHAKINRILNDDVEFINEIKKEQQKCIYVFKSVNNMNAFDRVLGITSLKFSILNCLNKQIISPIENYTVSVAEKQFIETVSTQKSHDVVFCSHMGLGDVLLNVGIINLLLNFYETVHYLCKKEYVYNVTTIFANKPVRLIPVDKFENDQIISNLATFNFDATDCILVGIIKHIPLLQSVVRNEHFNEYKRRFGTNTIENTLYPHIGQFYADTGIKYDVCFKYYDVHIPEESMLYYQKIQQYTIMFIHEIASTSSINLSKLVDTYIHFPNYIIICANRNVYPSEHPMHAVAQSFVNLPFMMYYDTIRNATDIHVIDSSFSCISFILRTMNAISPKTFAIYARDKPYNVVIEPSGQFILA